ncbi:MAG: LysM peptidoglycan-binding domain-containing protein, partial [Anaerolineae bacterium]|nr:LysM peptidoglycan-binding domain-containing protein [Anaerolineae bacterium]
MQRPALFKFLMGLACAAGLLALAPGALAQDAANTTYVVQPGDNLFRISLRYGVSVQAIAQANNIANVNLILVGQVLQIPGGTGATPPTAGQPPQRRHS